MWNSKLFIESQGCSNGFMRDASFNLIAQVIKSEMSFVRSGGDFGVGLRWRFWKNRLMRLHEKAREILN